MPKRGRGKKFSTNFVKTAIILFLSDSRKSTTEILEHLNENFGISEPKGVRVHLGKLYSLDILDKETRPGIETTWYWKNNIKSFKKIINFIHDESDLVKEIIESDHVKPVYVNLSDSDKQVVEAFFESLRPEFNVNRYWFRTSYAKSFFTKDTIEYFVNKAYSKYKKSTISKDLMPKDRFQNLILENRDYDALIMLMYYSPNLVLYITNLEDLYKEIINPKKIVSGVVFLTVMNDVLIQRLISEEGSTSTGFGIQWEPDHKNGLRMKLDCLLSNPVLDPRPAKYQVKR